MSATEHGARSARGASRSDPPVGWGPTLVALSAALLATGLLYGDTLRSMVEKWSHSQTFAHGFLIFPISATLVWMRRREIARMAPAPDARGFFLLVALSVMWLLGQMTNVLVVEQLAVVLMVPALVVTMAGIGVARALMFPLGYLLFAVPLGEELVPPLTEFTARFTLQAIQAVGVPIARDGYFLRLPGQTWEVTKACSGVRYLIASLAVGCIFAYLQFRTWRYRLGFVALAIVVPIAANGARAFGIVMLGYLTYGRLATGVDHLIYGWIFFAAVMMLLLWFGARIREPEPGRGGAPATSESTRDAGRGAPARRTAIFAVAAIAVSAMTLVAAHQFDRALDARASGLAARAPDGRAGWHGPEDTEDDWAPRFMSPTATIRKVYWKDGDRVQLYAAVYGRQRQGAEMISDMNRVYEVKRGWRRSEDRVRQVSMGGKPFGVIETELVHDAPDGRERRRLVWQWYVVSGTPTINAYMAKILDVGAILTGRREPSIAFAIAADYDAREGDAARVLGAFLEANESELRRAATAAGGRAATETGASIDRPGRDQGRRTIRSRTLLPPMVPTAS